ncbi:MAG: exopolysaccharide biosynthesis polyprenyl glycosylphosphotransferase [Candidatus Pacebacteria bacterium]|nr:exopolysaccharide biosynthesis polyprenyl glycosylphosphotransferase [Candidatus Paceibacterota bacterium]MDD4875417.1 exopolysaccharide biosynthesis polyprenyl glycosylphosphotransferase [Candidatus Paceibacterota bacterium]
MEKRRLIFKIFLLATDIFLMYASLLLALAIRYNDFSFLPGIQTKAFLLDFSIIHLFWILILYSLNFYEGIAVKSKLDFVKKNLIFVSLASIVGFIYFYLNPWTDISPKTILFLDIIIFSLFLYSWRFVLNFFFSKHLKKKIIIIGNSGEKELLEIVPELGRNGFNLVSIINPCDVIEEKNGFSGSNFPKEIIEREKIDLVVLDLSALKEEGSSSKIFSKLPLTVDYLSLTDFYEYITRKIPLESVDEIWFLENISKPNKKIYEASKRIFDIAFSLVGLAFLSLILPIIAVIMKIDSSGPIFYMQKRAGKNGKDFLFYKLRSMKESDDQHNKWRVNDDNQITRVGKFLRRINLDEFPQFYNILKGDLSFVGPRPEWIKLARLYEKEIPFYRQRYLVRPGFTGWAQINYPASSSIEEAKEKFKYDLYYIKNRSFFGDIAIILKTIKLLID